jgi:predicted transcriptional regulator
MDVIKLLKRIKGKVLNKEHYELLRQAYELQEQKLAFIQTVNKTLGENSDLLKEKIKRLEHEIGQLQLYLTEKEVNSGSVEFAGPEKHILEISDITIAILQECLRRDMAEFTADEMSDYLRYEQSKVEAAIAELVESGLISEGKSGQTGTVYGLTDTGRNYAKTL